MSRNSAGGPSEVGTEEAGEQAEQDKHEAEPEEHEVEPEGAGEAEDEVAGGEVSSTQRT